MKHMWLTLSAFSVAVLITGTGLALGHLPFGYYVDNINWTNPLAVSLQVSSNFGNPNWVGPNTYAVNAGHTDGNSVSFYFLGNGSFNGTLQITYSASVSGNSNASIVKTHNVDVTNNIVTGTDVFDHSSDGSNTCEFLTSTGNNGYPQIKVECLQSP